MYNFLFDRPIRRQVILMVVKLLPNVSVVVAHFTEVYSFLARAGRILVLALAMVHIIVVKVSLA